MSRVLLAALFLLSILPACVTDPAEGVTTDELQVSTGLSCLNCHGVTGTIPKNDQLAAVDDFEIEDCLHPEFPAALGDDGNVRNGISCMSCHDTGMK